MKSKTLLGMACAILVAVLVGMPAGTANAQLPPGMKSAWDWTTVDKGVHSFRFFFHRNMIVETSDGVIVTDPLNPKAAKILAGEIKKRIGKPVKLVIYSHDHWDHVLGGGVFKEQGAKIIAHKLAADGTTPHKAYAKPDETWTGDRKDVKLGDTTVELYYLGPNHGDGMVVMRLPDRKLLHIVDLVTPRRLAFRNMPDFIPREWIRSLKEIEKMDFVKFIPGHGPPVAPKAQASEFRQYMEDLRDAVMEAHVKYRGNPVAIRKNIKLPKYKDWAQYEAWLPMNVERMAMELRMGW